MSDPMDEMFDSNDAQVGEPAPSMAQLGSGDTKHTLVYAPGKATEQTVKNAAGRAVLIFATKFEAKRPSKQQNIADQDTIISRVVVLTGEPIAAKLDKDGEVAFEYDAPKVPPFEIEPVFFSHVMVVRDLKPKVNGKPVLARIVRLPPLTPGGNKSWALAAPLPGDFDIARKWFADNPAPDPMDVSD
jgi:hypothetical protein